MEFLTLYGIEIPGGTDNYGYWENFIRSTIETVLDNPDHIFVYNWTVSADFAEAIKEAVIQHFDLTSRYIVRSTTSYTLQDSTKYGDWDDTYKLYNCYAFAIDRTYKLNPGELANHIFTYIDLELLSNNVILDLNESNYSCVNKTTARPVSSSLPSGAKAICLRVCDYDYHFMKLSAGNWLHKPGKYQVLQWNHYSPGYKTWTNEFIDEYGDHYEGNTEYTGTIYYFIYKTSHSIIASDGVYTGEHYHSGSKHYYHMEHECTNCGATVYTWQSITCDGPPCSNYAPFGIQPISVETE